MDRSLSINSGVSLWHVTIDCSKAAGESTRRVSNILLKIELYCGFISPKQDQLVAITKQSRGS